MSIVVVAFGTVWLAVSLYTYAPVYRKAFFRSIGRSKDPRVYSEATELADDDLPFIDVLLPAYDESETIGHSIHALREAEYPVEKLGIDVLVEPSDRATRRELSRLRRRYEFREIVIPSSYPGARNKPRALNYGFERTDGDIVGVIDAEDLVAPGLFKQVVRALVDDGHDYAQGTLDMQNEDDGLLNTLFRGEYGLWYGTVIPSYFHVGYPVPLGGTTNFVKRPVLEAIAAERIERFGSPWTDADRVALADSERIGVTPWDPRNVTEDFELGLLLWETGRSMAMLTAVTREESPVGLSAWVRQRTRWQKGKLFTLYQRLSYPPAGFSRKIHIYTQSAMPHIGLINVLGVLFITIYVTLVGFHVGPVVAAILLGGLALALQQMVIHAIGYWTVTENRGPRRVLRTGINFVGVPLYWLLQWGSDIRAFVQLAFGHLSWEKTKHTGRHIEAERPTVAGTIAGFQLVVSRTDGGWLWAIEKAGTEVARAGRPASSEVEARQNAEIFSDVLPIARGSDAVFSVDRKNDDWGWKLVSGDRVTAVAPTPSPRLSGSLDGVDRVRLASEVASLGRTHDVEKRGTESDSGVAESV
ncbi:MAG: glycosyltransferase [Haloferacaceae archaeon]